MKTTSKLSAIFASMILFSSTFALASEPSVDPLIKIPPKFNPNAPQRKPGVNFFIPGYFYNGVLELSLRDFEYVDHGYVQVYNLDKNLATTIEIPQEAETVSIRLTDLPATYVINVSVNDYLFSGKYFFSD